MRAGMQLLAAALSLALLVPSQAASLRAKDGQIQSPKPPANFTGLDWALLIAGSAGWGNYRHQADISHAYQVLHDGGLPDERIVVMMADDLAFNPSNPHPGRLFNQPGGPDVYFGVPKDYNGPAVNVQNFLAVLSGDKDGLSQHNSSGKVVASGPKDRVFVYFSDHGAPGILGMPFGPFLYADQVQTVLRSKGKAGGFAELVFYIEACESGSILQGMLDDSITVYATTAANAFESSWGTYCPGMVPGPPPELSTCLGDLYSVAFLENSDNANLANETLEIQYEIVRLRTSNNDTYQQGSHVLQFGSKVIDEEPAGDYLGIPKAGAGGRAALEAARSRPLAHNVPQRDADLLPLWTAFLQAPAGAGKRVAQEALSLELDKRAAMEAAVRVATERMLGNMLGLLGDLLPGSELGLGDVVEQLTSGLLPPSSVLAPGLSATSPIVKDWGCLRGMVDTWQSDPRVGILLDQTTMRFSGAFANLCNIGFVPSDLKAALDVGASSERLSVEGAVEAFREAAAVMSA